MQGAVDNKVIRKRSEILHTLGSELALNYQQQFLGETAQVLIENTKDEGRPTRDEGRHTRIRGRSERYFKVKVVGDVPGAPGPTDEMRRNQIINVKLVENHEDEMIGKPE
jgi:tRNA A37 methylthiotransferase MiaB